MIHTFPLTHREIMVEPIPLSEQKPCLSGGRYRNGFVEVAHGTNTVRQTIKDTTTGRTSTHDMCVICNERTLDQFASQERSAKRARKLTGNTLPT